MGLLRFWGAVRAGFWWWVLRSRLWSFYDLKEVALGVGAIRCGAQAFVYGVGELGGELGRCLVYACGC